MKDSPGITARFCEIPQFPTILVQYKRRKSAVTLPELPEHSGGTRLLVQSKNCTKIYAADDVSNPVAANHIRPAAMPRSSGEIPAV